jgi:hypothetical protein
MRFLLLMWTCWPLLWSCLHLQRRCLPMQIFAYFSIAKFHTNALKLVYYYNWTTYHCIEGSYSCSKVPSVDANLLAAVLKLPTSVPKFHTSVAKLPTSTSKLHTFVGKSSIAELKLLIASLKLPSVDANLPTVVCKLPMKMVSFSSCYKVAYQCCEITYTLSKFPISIFCEITCSNCIPLLITCLLSLLISSLHFFFEVAYLFRIYLSVL